MPTTVWIIGTDPTGEDYEPQAAFTSREDAEAYLAERLAVAKRRERLHDWQERIIEIPLNPPSKL